MSRIENGTTTVRPHDIETLLDSYRDSGVAIDDIVRRRLRELVAAGRRKEWFSEEYRDVIGGDMTDDHVARYIGYETYASTFANFEPEVVPGLLQTRRYARAVIDAHFPDHTEHQRERLVDLRLQRRRVIEKQGSPRLDFIIGEGALRRSVRDVDAQAEQLTAIANEIRNGSPNVGVRVFPADLLVPAALGGPFVVMTFVDEVDPSVVYLETRAGAVYLSDPASVEHYQDALSALAKSAYTDDEAVARIEEVLNRAG